MSIWMTFLTAAPILSVIFVGAWVYQRFIASREDAGIVDVVWASSVGLIAIYFAIVADGDTGRRVLIGLMGGMWSARLAWHIHERNHGKPEDTRYAHMRLEWGERVQIWFFAFYQIQAVAAWLLTIGFLVIASDDRALNFSDPLLILGIAAYGVALIGGAVSDKQLADFKAADSNHGKLFRDGLWAYSRHPNYFFECMLWSSYVAVGILAQWGWLTILPAAVMIFLLTRMTGLPNNEAQNLRTKREAYKAYQAEVSGFIPWFPKK